MERLLLAMKKLQNLHDLQNKLDLNPSFYNNLSVKNSALETCYFSAHACLRLCWKRVSWKERLLPALQELQDLHEQKDALVHNDANVIFKQLQVHSTLPNEQQ